MEAIFVEIKKLLNFLFPENGSETSFFNKKWVKTVAALGPLLTTLLVLEILLSWIFLDRAISLSQGFILFNICLFTSVCLFISRKVKQRKRNPTLLFLFMFYAALVGFLALQVSAGMQSSWEKSEARWKEHRELTERLNKKSEEEWKVLQQKLKEIDEKEKVAKMKTRAHFEALRNAPVSASFNDVEEKVKANDIDPVPFPSLVETFIQNQKNQKLERNRIFKSSVLSKIALISDRDLMRREVFYTEKFPRNRRYVVGFEKILEEFFKAYEKESFVPNYKDYEMTEEQSQLLCKFYGQSKAYLEKTSHGQYDRISKDPEWQEIQDLGKEVLRVCEYKKTPGL
jgi:hypothetical protein